MALTAKAGMTSASTVQQEKKKLAMGKKNIAMKAMARKATQKLHQREPTKRKATLS